MTIKSILSLVVPACLVLSCSMDPLDVDTQGIKIETGFLNLDSMLYHASQQERIELHHKFLNEIGEIYEYELGYCLNMGSPEDSVFGKSIQLFFADKYVSRLEKRIQEKFSDLTVEKNELTEGFKHLKYHFPNGRIPKDVVFMNSLFASSAFSTETQIGIGLERYLGGKTDVVRELPYQDYPEWEKEAMDRKFMTRDAMCSWIMTHYVEEEEGNLAQQIIRWGKILYLTQAAFPDKTPAGILRYSEEDYKWSVDNEYALWKFLVDEKLLFKIDELNAKNLLSEGPYTPGLPEKGPDRLGQFLGYRMIVNYMEIKNVSLEELVKTSYSDILVEYEID